MTNTINETTATQIELIKEFYLKMEAAGIGEMKRFAAIARESLNCDWFSARGIKEKTGSDYRTFFTELFDSSKPNFILNHFDVMQVENFSNSLVDKVGDNIKEAKTEVKEVKQANEISETKVTEAGEIEEVETEIAEVIEKKVERKKDNVAANFNLVLPLNEMINTAVTDYIENESGLLARVNEKIEAEARKLRPNVIQISDRKPVEVKGRLHNAFKKTLQLSVLERQVFVAGAAGTGKTTLAEQIAKALELRFGHISCTAGMSEAHLLGRMDAHGNYLQSQFVDLYENGGVFLFDEVDAADSNTMLIINSALANGAMSVPNRKEKPTAKRHEDFICICAANTWGFGSNEYAGRNILDAAFLDRFTGSRIVVDYDLEMEKEIAGEQTELLKAIWKIRDNVKKNRIRRVVSTRAIVSGVRQINAGIDLKDFINTFLTGWTDEEQKKAKEGI
jgi:cobaltochelatase CobS